MKDILLVTVSDFHSGSNYALFLKRGWTGRQGQSHHPRSWQIAIRNHFESFASQVKTARKGKKVILVHNGDAIDGDHHNSGDVCTTNELEQAEIHIELMEELRKSIGWERGDELYYTRGTQSHTQEYEEYIAQQTNAIPSDDGNAHELLSLRINNRLIWFVHHGPRRGKGASEGSPVVSWLKNIYNDAIKDEREIPDIVYTGHVHDPTYAAYSWRKRMTFSLMHGVILPSWQRKTRYAHMAAPVSVNKIGGVTTEIKSDGTICTPKFYILES